VYVAEIATAGLPAGSRILFTWRYQACGAWAGTDFAVEVVSSA